MSTTKLHKLEAAKRQLEAAMEIYLAQGDFLAVVTLAGAAEEIFGDLLRRTGAPRMLDHLTDLDREVTGGRKFSDVNEDANGIRNSLKHARHESEDELEIDPEHAVAMLMRAIANYVALGNEPSPAMVRIYNVVRARQIVA